MSIIYNRQFYKDKHAIDFIQSNVSTLYKKIKQINVNHLEISDYSKVYLKKHIDSLEYLFQMYTHIVYHLKQQTLKPFNEITVIDHGAGVGLLTAFCQSLGMKVIYNDVYKTVLEDAENIAEYLEISYDAYIHGNHENIIEYCQKEKIRPNAVISSEVIEHIYDLDNFLKALDTIPSEQLSFVFSTSANKYNPIRNKKLVALQKRAELKDKKGFEGHKDRDSLQSFLSIRETIIRDNFPKITQEEIKNLAIKTRGLRKDDIINAVNKYLKTGNYPKELAHQTNTCDPLTGNWAEHLLNPFKLQTNLQQMGFKTKITNGFYGYNTYESPTKKLAKKFLNKLIFSLEKNGLYLTHYWMLVGKKSI
jgi:2-polyprenyl-3-methyl-5-hydroxy-6-metoxy-1,4-benzoquinol methylase